MKSLIGGIIPAFLFWKATEFDKYACGCVTMGKKLAVRGFGMQILRVINNNVISSLDDEKREVVVMGKGVGFQKKAGDPVDVSRIEKIFQLPKEHTNQYERLVSDMPYEHIKMAEEIIQYAARTLKRHLNKNIYITLTDHLDCAIERQKQGTVFQNALLWEIRKFYEEEFQIGCRAVALVKEKTGVELPEDEAGFIALHIVNAEMDGDIRKAGTIPEMIKDILNIVRYTFNVEVDESDLSYERFVTHLKFFLQRAVQNVSYDNDDPELDEIIRTRYPREYACADKIRAYMKKRMKYEVEEEELTYLTMHIARIIRRNSSDLEH